MVGAFIHRNENDTSKIYRRVLGFKSVDHILFSNGRVRLWLETIGGLQFVMLSYIATIYAIADTNLGYMRPKLASLGKEKKFMITTLILVYL